jgi:hypothetical protein
MIKLTKHATEKIKTRRMDLNTVKEVLQNPQYKFYDSLRNSEISAKNIKLDDRIVTLVVAYTRIEGDYNVITVYPVRDFNEEMDRKVKSGRWLVL